eukprot:4649282-Pyramimonas_sp.AAC.1
MLFYLCTALLLLLHFARVPRPHHAKPDAPEEDDQLHKLILKHGAKNWSLIAQGIPGRSGKSCRLRCVGA